MSGTEAKQVPRPPRWLARGIQSCFAYQQAPVVMVGLEERSAMIDVIFQVIVLHHEDDHIQRPFSLEAQLPALPPNLVDTQFKFIPGVATVVREPLLTWNQVLQRYVISGFIRPTTAEGFELLLTALPKQGWHEEESRHKDAPV
jgi:hypothetical protein